MTPCTETAERLLERCTERRGWLDRWAVANPADARSYRKSAAEHGWTADVDDPVIRVRASELEALCRALLGIEAPTESDDDQLTLEALWSEAG